MGHASLTLQLEPSADLLRTVLELESLLDLVPGALLDAPRVAPGTPAQTCHRQGVRLLGAIAAPAAIALEFSLDRRIAALQVLSGLGNPMAQADERLNLVSFVLGQVRVSLHIWATSIWRLRRLGC